MIILKTEDLSKVYQMNYNYIHAVTDCNMEIASGEFAVITGLRGSGKSTLLHMLGGLDRPTSGRVLLEGKDLSSPLSLELQSLYRKKIGFIIQNYQLIPGLTVYENIVMPLLLTRCPLDREYLLELTDTLHITSVLHSYPRNITEDERQCAVIARALVNQPEIILADEPTKNLKHSLAKDILDLLMNYISWYRKTLVFVTQDPDIVIFADHVIELDMGRIISDRKIRKQPGQIKFRQMPELYTNPMKMKPMEGYY